MGLTLQSGTLFSRAARAKVGAGGIRTFDCSKLTAVTSQGITNIVEWVIDAVVSFGGWLCQKFWKSISPLISWSLAQAWEGFCSEVEYFWEFDWSASDQALDQSLQSAWNAFNNQLQELTAKAAGSLVFFGGGAVLFLFNEALGLYVLRNFGSVVFDQLAASAASVLQSAGSLTFRWLFVSAYKAIRNAIGLSPNSLYPNDADLNQREKEGEITPGQKANIIKGRDALTRQRKPYTFVKKFENWLESLPEEIIKSLIRQFFEGDLDFVQEPGYVVPGPRIDEQIATYKLAYEIAAGLNSEVAVQVQFNRNIGAFGGPTST